MRKPSPPAVKAWCIVQMLPGRPRDRLLSWTLSNTRREAWVKLRNNCVDEAQFERDRESSRAVRVTVAQERP